MINSEQHIEMNAQQRGPPYRFDADDEEHSDQHELLYRQQNPQHSKISPQTWIMYLFVAIVIALLAVIAAIIGHDTICLNTDETGAYLQVDSIVTNNLQLRPSFDVLKLDEAMEKYELVAVAEGIFSMYTINGTTGNSLLWMEISLEMLNVQFLVSAIFDKGDGDNALYHLPADDYSDQTTYYFSFSNILDGVDLVQANYAYRTTDEQSEEALRQGMYKGWVETFPLVSYNLDSSGQYTSVVIDVKDYFTESGAFVFPVSLIEYQNEFQFTKKISGITAYPNNLNVKVNFDQVHSIDDPSTNSFKGFGVHYSLILLPEEPMTGRIADDRVGYFTIGYTDIGSHDDPVEGIPPNTNLYDYQKVDTEVFFINKCNIQVDDECNVWKSRNRYSYCYIQVVKGVVYHIDPSVPQRWRNAVKEGVEAWNLAFDEEVLGCTPTSNVITALLPDDDSFPEDYDAGDARYNSISWYALASNYSWYLYEIRAVSTSSTFAIGPSNVDPRSGEILNADIVFTHSWIHSYASQFDQYQPDGMGFKPEYTHHKKLTRCSHDTDHDIIGHIQAEHDLLGLHFAGLEFSEVEEIIAHGLTDVTMHEVGHTLGLRHNFKASSAINWEQIQNVSPGIVPLTTSVMDYAAVNIQSDPAKQANFFARSIGEYDQWVIRYGYTIIPDEKHGAKHFTLNDIASMSETDPLLYYSTDEDDPSSTGQDPISNYFDLAASPLDYYYDRLEMIRELRSELIERAVIEGDSYVTTLPYYESLLSSLTFCGNFASKYYGGLDIRKHHRVDNGGSSYPLNTIASADQQRALELIFEILFDDDLVLGPSNQYRYLVSRTGVCNGLSRYCDGTVSVNIIDLVTSARFSILQTLTDSDRLNRMTQYVWAFDDQPTASQLFQNITNEILDRLLATEVPVTVLKLAPLWVNRLTIIAGTGCDEVELAAGVELERLQDSLHAMNLASHAEARAISKKVDQWDSSAWSEPCV